MDPANFLFLVHEKIEDQKKQQFMELFEEEKRQNDTSEKASDRYKNELSVIRESEANHLVSNLTNSPNSIQRRPQPKIQVQDTSGAVLDKVEDEKVKDMNDIIWQLKRMSEYTQNQAQTSNLLKNTQFRTQTSKQSEIPTSTSEQLHIKKRGVKDGQKSSRKPSLSVSQGDASQQKLATPNDSPLGNRTKGSRAQSMSSDQGITEGCFTQTKKRNFRKVKPKRIVTMIMQGSEDSLLDEQPAEQKPKPRLSTKNRLSIRRREFSRGRQDRSREGSYEPKINKVCQTDPWEPPRKLPVLKITKPFQTLQVDFKSKTTQNLAGLETVEKRKEKRKKMSTDAKELIFLDKLNSEGVDVAQKTRAASIGLNFDGLDYLTLERLRSELEAEKVALINKFFKVQGRIDSILRSVRKKLRKEREEIRLGGESSRQQDSLKTDDKTEIELTTITKESKTNNTGEELKENIFGRNINKNNPKKQKESQGSQKESTQTSDKTVDLEGALTKTEVSTTRTSVGIQSTTFQIDDKDIIYSPKITMKWRRVPASDLGHSFNISTHKRIQAARGQPFDVEEHRVPDQGQRLTSLVPIQEVKNLNIAYQYNDPEQVKRLNRGQSADYRISSGVERFRRVPPDRLSRSVEGGFGDISGSEFGSILVFKDNRNFQNFLKNRFQFSREISFTKSAKAPRKAPKRARTFAAKAAKRRFNGVNKRSKMLRRSANHEGKRKKYFKVGSPYDHK